MSCVNDMLLVLANTPTNSVDHTIPATVRCDNDESVDVVTGRLDAALSWCKRRAATRGEGGGHRVSENISIYSPHTARISDFEVSFDAPNHPYLVWFLRTMPNPTTPRATKFEVI